VGPGPHYRKIALSQAFLDTSFAQCAGLYHKVMHMRREFRRLSLLRVAIIK